ncbi:MAG: ATP-dependent 6-phosphofructokinase, partial [Ilumatobacteraceae bacterium]
MRVGILTGGGDCPGLNAVIRAIVRKGERVHGDELVGFLDAWDGVRARRTIPLTVESMRGTLPRGGTVLGTRRGSPFDSPTGVDEVKATLNDLGIDALVVIGGNGSLSVASQLFAEERLPIVGVPKTIDNDIVGTDVTFGFNTAVQIATDAIDRLHTTAESHDRVMVVEVMGRHSGWIAVHAGIAGGAAMVLIPEIPFDIEEICARISKRHEGGRYASIVVVAEGTEPVAGTLDIGDRLYDEFGHVRLGGIADVIAREIGGRTGFETRVVSLGHVQRGGTPTAFDRVLSTRFGVAAIDLVHAGGWGQMVVARGSDIVAAPLNLTIGRT